MLRAPSRIVSSAAYLGRIFVRIRQHGTRTCHIKSGPTFWRAELRDASSLSRACRALLRPSSSRVSCTQTKRVGVTDHTLGRNNDATNHRKLGRNNDMIHSVLGRMNVLGRSNDATSQRKLDCNSDLAPVLRSPAQQPYLHIKHFNIRRGKHEFIFATVPRALNFGLSSTQLKWNKAFDFRHHNSLPFEKAA